MHSLVSTNTPSYPPYGAQPDHQSLHLLDNPPPRREGQDQPRVASRHVHERLGRKTGSDQRLHTSHSLTLRPGSRAEARPDFPQQPERINVVTNGGDNKDIMAHVRRRDDSETTSTSTSRGALESQPLLSATKESYVPGDSRLVATSSQALQGKNEQQDPRTMSLEEKEAEVNNRMAELEIMKKRVEEDRAALEDRKERLKKRERAFRRNSDEQSRNAENSTREVKKGVNNEFLKAVECPICSDILAAPHVLTCGHSFCFSDIHTMALNAFSLELDGFVNFHCPLCRVPILIPGYNPEVHKVAPPFYCSPCRPLQAVIELATRNMQDLGVEGWGEEGEELQRWKQREKEGQDLAEMIKLHWSNNDARDLFSSLKQSML